MGKGILMYETTLSPEAKSHLKEIGQADIVIGIPSHRNGRTISEVLRAISKSLTQHLASQRIVLMNADGGSADNTARHVSEMLVPPNVHKLVTTYEGIIGKGTAVRSIFEASSDLRAKACVIVEARAPGIDPTWLPALIKPVLEGKEASFARYQRSAYAAALTDNLVYPFVRTIFNIELREPLPNEFCVSGTLAEELAGKDVWETDVARFGLNIWLTLQTLIDGHSAVQVDLGYRGDPSGEPGAMNDARILHTVGTLFRFLTVHEKYWRKGPQLVRVPLWGERRPDRFVPGKDCVSAFLTALGYGKRHCQSEWRKVLEPETMQAVWALLEQPPEAFEFDVNLWARVVAEFAVAYNKGEGDPDKVVETFLPLFYGRAASYVRRTGNLTPMERESTVQEILRAFAQSRTWLEALWNRQASLL